MRQAPTSTESIQGCDHESARDCPLGHLCAANDEAPPTSARGRNRIVCACGAVVCQACGLHEWYQTN